MKRMPIRTKVAAALSLPLLALLVFSALEVRRAAQGAAEVRDETALARAAVGPSGIISRLQDERTWAAVELVGLESQYEVLARGYGPTRKATDDAIRAFRADVTSKGGAVEDIYRRPLADLDELASIRADIDAFKAPRVLTANMPFDTSMYDRYSRVIHGMLDANAGIPLQVRDDELRQGTDLAEVASHQIELNADVSRQTVVAATLSPNGIDTPEEINTIASLLARLDRNNERLLGATGRYADVVRKYFPTAYAKKVDQDVQAAIRTGTLGNLNQFLDDIAQAGQANLYQRLRDSLSSAVVDRADTLNTDANTRQRLFVLLAVVTFGAAATMTWLVSRSITRPLESLTRQAADMAAHRLPDAVLDILATPIAQDVEVPPVDPITVETRDEVANVAATLNTVQTSALDLAVEQALLRRNIADTFVNLGRRNQNLLSRQLDFITQLESQETNPETLASLFQLDHLATRMRRNAESLLVLAGIDPPRRWAAPVSLVDVIRAALGEIEDFQRVQIDRVAPAMINGTTATDLAHLLAELLENALAFSPPNQAVEVRGWDRHPGYTLAVIDYGLGMPPDELERANRRLAGMESFTVAPSKYLGHYVAGTLAARHGIRIALSTGPGQGVVAIVEVPVDEVGTPSVLTTRLGGPGAPMPVPGQS
jgi:signal transduction histidine kinase